MNSPTPGMAVPGPRAGGGRPNVQSSSIADLVSEVTQDLSILMRQELRLAQAELKQEAVKSGKAAGAFGGAGLAGYMTLLFLSIAVWLGLSNVMDSGVAALIIAALWAVTGLLLYVTGRQKLRAVDPRPERTAETLKELPDALRGR